MGNFLTAFMSRFRSNLTFACHMLTASQCDLLCRIWRSCHVYQMRHFSRAHIVDSTNWSKHNAREVICVAAMAMAMAAPLFDYLIHISFCAFSQETLCNTELSQLKSGYDAASRALPPCNGTILALNNFFIDWMNLLVYNNYQMGKCMLKKMDWKHASTKCNDLSLKGVSDEHTLSASEFICMIQNFCYDINLQNVIYATIYWKLKYRTI